MKYLTTLSIFVATAIILTGFMRQSEAQVELFGPVQAASIGKTTSVKNSSIDRDGLKRSNIVALKNPEGLQQSSIILNLFSDKSLKVTMEKMEEYDQAMKGWKGKIEGDPLSSVTIYFKGNWLSGRVSREGELYTFNTDANGTITVLDIDESKLLQELDVVKIQ